jgi:hypothetical protein
MSKPNKTPLPPVTPLHVYLVYGTFLAPCPAGKRGAKVDLEKIKVLAKDRMNASASIGKFLNDTGRFARATDGERFSRTFAINHLHIDDITPKKDLDTQADKAPEPVQEAPAVVEPEKA